MKYTFLNNTNIDVTDDLKKVTDFFKSKGWEIIFDVQKTTYTLSAPVNNGNDNGQIQWVIKPNIPYTGKTILMFNPIPVTGGYITSTTINKDFITIVYNSNLWKSVSHEIMHSLFKTYAPMLDCMDFGQFLVNGKYEPHSYYKNDDPYATDGNFAEAFKRLEPYKTMQPTYKHFKLSEPTGGGHTFSELNEDFRRLLDKMRGECGFPFIIESGLRTQAENDALKDSVSDSAHLSGLSADIRCTTSIQRFKMVQVALSNGVTRIGIGKNFIHIDIDKTKPQNVIWHYYH